MKLHGRTRLRPRLTYANVVATLALFIALGGASYAAFHLPNNSVRSKNIVNGQVKRSDIGSRQVSAGKIAKPEALHLVGTAGQPLFQPTNQRTWTNLAIPGSEVSFYRDQVGIVHLSGTALCTSASGGCGPLFAGTVFTLPPGYRPPVDSRFLVDTGSSGVGNIVIYGKDSPLAGNVAIFEDNAQLGGDGANVSFDGISYRGG